MRFILSSGIFLVGCIPLEFKLAELFKKTTMVVNTMHSLVDSIFSNTESPIGDINKAWIILYMGASKYLPHYDSSRRKWILGSRIFYSN